jgi:tetratricopeptide (TPR) repeat protein
VFHAELGEPPRLDEPVKPAAPSDQTEKGAKEPKIALTGDPLTDARNDVLAGRYDAAIKRLEALRNHPPSETQALRATLLEAQAVRLALRPERAVPLLEHVAWTNSAIGSHEAEQAQVMLAQTLGRDLGDQRRAADAWAEAQRRWPNGMFKEEAAFRLGESLLAAGENREGVAALERYLSTFPKAAHVDEAHLLVAGARRDRLADCSGALPHLHAVAAGDGTRAEAALIGEARCLKQVGRVAEAQKLYAKYLSDRPRGRFADEARLEAAGRAAR